MDDLPICMDVQLFDLVGMTTVALQMSMALLPLRMITKKRDTESGTSSRTMKTGVTMPSRSVLQLHQLLVDLLNRTMCMPKGRQLIH
jgi:hypothetical protein